MRAVLGNQCFRGQNIKCSDMSVKKLLYVTINAALTPVTWCREYQYKSQVVDCYLWVPLKPAMLEGRGA